MTNKALEPKPTRRSEVLIRTSPYEFDQTAEGGYQNIVIGVTTSVAHPQIVRGPSTGPTPQPSEPKDAG